MIAAVDEFIIYDDMQYTRRDWRNRNQIKTAQGVQWLTVPVQVRGKYLQTIRDTNIDGRTWAKDHWRALCLNYRRSPHYDEIAGLLEPLYLGTAWETLSALNRSFIEQICRYLKISTKISNSWDYDLADGKSERLANICMQAGATEYVSGPAARDYLEPDVFGNLGMRVTWFDYAEYPEYPQLWGGGFVHSVSVVDLLFNCGHKSPQFMRCGK